jgi:1-acyl-sn-glycerol-3-phosphate acyltransferase
MLTVIIVALVIIGLAVLLSKKDKDEKPYTETICGNCGGPDCVMGCDKPSTGYDPVEAANKASDKLDKEFCKAIGIEQPISASFIKPEKERLVTEDEIRHAAYMLAADDNFSKSPETYWHEAKKLLTGDK